MSEASKITLHKVFPVQYGLMRYSWDNIAQIKTLGSVIQEASNNIAQVKTLSNVVLEASDNNVQHKSPVQCSLNTLGATMHRLKP